MASGKKGPSARDGPQALGAVLRYSPPKVQECTPSGLFVLRLPERLYNIKNREITIKAEKKCFREIN
jgi:hypothetical protein